MKDGEDFSAEEINHRLTRNASFVGMSFWNNSATRVQVSSVGFLWKFQNAESSKPTKTTV
jgi:hypothetical protein